jgi:hypothetical protein
MRGAHYNNLFGAGGVPSWALAGSAIDLDFANGRYFGGTLASLLSVTRASNATDLLPSSASGYAYNTYAPNVLAISPTFGLLIFEARTNLLLNSTAPATQTTASLGTGTYTLWCNGSGSALASGGSATITGAASATNGSPNTFTVTVAGTVTVTVTGSLNAFQLEAGAFGTSFIVTAGATATRAADNVTFGAAAIALLNSASGQTFVKVISSQASFPVAISGSINSTTIFEQSSSTQWIMWNGSTSLTANLGSGTGAGPVKGVASWTPSGRTLVVNNGTETTNAGLLAIAPPPSWILGNLNSTRYENGAIAEIAFWSTPSQAAARKAFTV